MKNNMNIPEKLNLATYFLYQRLNEGLGEKTALRFGELNYTYQEIADRSSQFAQLLLDADIRRGERVMVILPDIPPFAWAVFGILARGSVLVMVNPDTPESTMEYLVEYTGATAIVTVPKVAAFLRKVKDKSECCGEVRRIWIVPDVETGLDPEQTCQVDKGAIEQELTVELKNYSSKFSPVSTFRDEPSIWLFTSGSTGKPKANIHTNGDFVFNTEVYAKNTVGYKQDDITVSVPRLFFGYATGTNLFFPFSVGATTALFSERPTVQSLSKALAMYKPTVITNVPTMIGKLLDYDKSLRDQGDEGLDFSSVRFSLSAGEALPEALLNRWNKRFNSDVYDGIGSAEMFHIYCSNRPGDIKPGSLGKPVDGYELKILPESCEFPGGESCRPNEVGVLWVRGDSIALGYWKDRPKSWRMFHGHWCRTGDLFRFDTNGYLYFVGRADDLIKVSGQWLAPIEVEQCLLTHEAISLTAVVGVEDKGLVKPMAFVVLKGGKKVVNLSDLAAELKQWVKNRLSPHKYPRMIEFVADLPKNDRGKIDRKALVAIAASGSHKERY